MKTILLMASGILLALAAACESFRTSIEGRYAGKRYGVEVTIGEDAATVDKPAGATVDVSFTGPDGQVLGEPRTVTIPTTSIPIPRGAKMMHVTKEGSGAPPQGGSGGGAVGGLLARLSPPQQPDELHQEEADFARVFAMGFPLDFGYPAYSVEIDASRSHLGSAFATFFPAILPVLEGGPGVPVPEWMSIESLVSTNVEGDGMRLIIADQSPFSRLSLDWAGAEAYATLAHGSASFTHPNDWHSVEILLPLDQIETPPNVYQARLEWDTEDSHDMELGGSLVLK